MEIRNTWKRILAMVLVACMLAGFVPTGVIRAYADEIQQEESFVETNDQEKPIVEDRSETPENSAPSDESKDEEEDLTNDAPEDTDEVSSVTEEETVSVPEDPEQDLEAEKQIAENEEDPEDEEDLEALLQLLQSEVMTLDAGDSSGINIPTSSDASSFLTSGSINKDGSWQSVNGNLEVTEDTLYGFRLTFAENENLQFADTITYTFPQGFVVEPCAQKSVQFNVFLPKEDGSGDQAYPVTLNYSIQGNVLTMTIPQQENYDKFFACANATYTINFEGEFDGTKENVLWSASIESIVDIQDKPEVTNDIQVWKNGTYDKENGKIDYDITVTSIGTNNNVVVTDTVTGAALTLDEASIRADKGSVTSSSANGFTYSIDSMGNYEQVHIYYSCAVNTDIVNNSTITGSKTGNDVAVTSTEDPEGSNASREFDNTIKTPTKIAKSHGELQQADGVQTVSWQIDVNADHAVTMGGDTIKDTIDFSSRDAMEYSGSGIHVLVKDESGNTIREQDILWESLTSASESSWTYTVPEGEGKYEYIITYTTEVDSSGLIADTTLKNTASTGSGSGASSGVDVTVDDALKPGVQKELTESSYDKFSWKITLTVPGSGLNSASVVDTLPGMAYAGYLFQDTLELSSVSVEGLYEGESYTAPYDVSAAGNGGEYRIDFTKDAAGTPGLLPSTDGNPRTITITLTTDNDSEWLKYIETHPLDPSIHTNTATFYANNVTLSDTAEGKPSKETLQKEFKGTKLSAGYSSEATGWQVVDAGKTVYTYVLTINGISGDLDIKDTFDSECLELYVGNGYESAAGTGYNYMHITGQDKSSWGSYDLGLVQYEVTGGTLHMTATKEQLSKEDGSMYDMYFIGYGLAEKSEGLLKQKAIENGGTYTIGNSAVLASGVSASADAEYDYKGLDKTVSDVVFPTDGTAPYVTYTLTVNPDAIKLDPDGPEGGMLTVTDTFSETLSIDYTSIQVNPSEGVSYDVNGHTATFHIPDGVKTVITYKSRIIGAGYVNIYNTAKVLNYSAESKKENIHVTDDGTASGSNPSVVLLKYEEGNMQKGLAGAVFQLFNADGTSVKAGTAVTFTTNDKGIVVVAGNQAADGWTLWKGRTYYLQEITPPEGYQLKTTKYYFTIVDNSEVNYDELKYSNGDIVKVKNSPIPEPIDINGEKTWAGDTGKESRRPASITIRLMNGETEVRSTTATAENGWKWSFTGLTKNDESGAQINYTITEDPVTGYTSEVNGFNVTNTYVPETVDVSGEKTWVDGGNETGRPASITVKLMNGDTVVKTATVTAADGWKYSFTGLPKYDDDDQQIVYTVSEDAVSGYTMSVNGTNLVNTKLTEVEGTKTWNDNNNQDGIRPSGITIKLMNGTVTVATQVVEPDADGNWKWSFRDLPAYDGDTKINYTIEEDTVTGYDKTIHGYNVTNTHTPETVTLEGVKTWNDNDNQDGKRPASIDVYLVVNDVKTDVKVSVTEKDGVWSYKFENLPKYSDGKLNSYSVVDEVTGYTASTEGSNLINSHTPETVDINGEKTWAGDAGKENKRPASITIRLMNGETEVRNTTASAENGWKWSFTGLPKYNNGTEITYSIKEDEVTGYTTEVNGYNVTNTYVPETVDISGEKTWVDGGNVSGRPDSITVKVMNGETTVRTATVTAADGWKYSFTGLPKYDDDDQQIVYTVSEDAVSGYKTVSKGNNLINIQLIDLEGSKTWNDSNDNDRKRPESITIHLLANGTEKDSVTVTAADGWKWTFRSMPKYDEEGSTITYTVSEDTVANYASVVNGLNVTNTYTPYTVNVDGVKTWNDNENQDGLRPTKITVRLMKVTAEGDKEVAYKEVKPNEQGVWSWKFENLKKYENGVEIQYKVVEDAVEGYTAQVNGYNITNTHIPSLIDLKVTKEWDDNSNNDGKRPASITVTLKADGEVVDTKIVEPDTSGKWEAEFKDLPEYKAGEKITYTVEEAAVTNYEAPQIEAVEGGFKITNKHADEKTSVSVQKSWNDNNNQDGIRPEKVTFYLYKGNDAEPIDHIELSSANEWKHTFTGLPKYANGTPIVYTVKESAVTGYTSSEDEVNNVTVITNSHTPETTEISGKKVWADNNDQDRKRPGKITVYLMNGTTVVDSVDVTAANNWEWKFSNLPKYANGTLINYTFDEANVPEYSKAIDGTTITNSYTPGVTKVEGQKTWNDNNDADRNRPTSITITLYDGADKVDEKTVTKDDGWKWSFTNLPVFRNGKEAVYRIEETPVREYTSEVNGYNVTNDYNPEKTSVSVTKQWIDRDNADKKRPASITVAVYDGETKVTEHVLTPDENGNWSSYTFENLTKYRQGTLIDYSVREEAVEYYETPVYETSPTTGAVTIKNTYFPEVTELSVTKVWDDNNNADGKRPTEIKVAVYDGETKVEEKIVKAAEDGSWSCKFTGLPKNRDGKAIEYIVKEETVTGYTPAIVKTDTGYTITNKYAPDVTSVEVTKTWSDNDNADGLRPTSIKITLWDGETEVETKTVTPDADGKWSCKFENLPKNRAGAAIVYRVTEETVTGYTPEITATDTGYAIENKHTPETTGFAVNKTWDDNSNQDGKRPTEIKIAVYDGETKVAEKTVKPDEAGGWNCTFTGLQKNRDGKEIEYIVKEETVDGYEPTIVKTLTGYTITNKHTPATTEIYVTKTWDDNNDQDGKRPTEITVYLYNGDTKVDELTVKAAEDGSWSCKFDGLPKYQNGEEISYIVKEKAVDGYTAAVSPKLTGGFGITNTHVPEKVDLKVTKNWKDANNQDGKRPESIEVQLIKGDTVLETKTMKASEGWEVTFEGYPKYENGVEIVYTVKEKDVEGYTASVDGLKITNEHVPETVKLTIEKAWDDDSDRDGKRPEKVTIQVLDGDKKVVAEKEVVTNGTNTWSASVENLPKYKDGKEIPYTIQELTVEGYESKVDGFTVTNTHTPETVKVEGTKTWDDAENQDGKRPASIEIKLKANGEVIKTLTVTAADGWKWSFTDLYKYEKGKEITYSIEETKVEAYETEIDGFDVKNTHVPEKVSVFFAKVWDDKDDQDGKRPDSITVSLYAGKEKVDEKKVTKETSYSGSFTELPKYKDGKEIVYSIQETAVEGYTTKIEKLNSREENTIAFAITNLHTPEEVSVSIKKYWSDNGNEKGLRASFGLTLYADGKIASKEVMLSKYETGYTWTGLPKYKDGKEIKYTIVESTIPKGYHAVYGNGSITNVLYVPGLPQTGLLWWPAGLLAAVGTTLTAAGAKLRKKEHEENK